MAVTVAVKPVQPVYWQGREFVRSRGLVYVSGEGNAKLITNLRVEMGAFAGLIRPMILIPRISETGATR